MIRNWKQYTQNLIKRGEIYINPVFLKSWIKEINEMNRNKLGKPYLYPNSMIEYLAILHCKGFDFRSLQGILQVLSKKLINFPVICYTQIQRRISKLKIIFNTNSNNVGIDGSGFKVNNYGDWIRKKWNVQRGWIKVVIMGNVNGKIVAVRVGSEKLSELSSARGMLRKNKVKKVYLDGLHDSRKTFNLCDKLNIEPIIKIKKGSTTKSKSSPLRRKCVIEFQKLGYEKWSKDKQYGLRWPATEGIFSAVKRIFGEELRCRKKKNMYKEAKRKFWAYNKLLELGLT